MTPGDAHSINLFNELMRHRIVMADGAMGTMLMDAKSACHLPALLNTTSPETVAGIHRQYIDAGADIITTNTFCPGTPTGKTEVALDNIYRLSMSGAKIARMCADSAPHKVWVAGSIGPAYPSATLDSGLITRFYTQQIEALVDGGADFIFLETVTDLNTVKIAKTAMANVRACSGKEIRWAISYVPSEDGQMLSRQKTATLIEDIYDTAPLFVGINCVSHPDTIANALDVLADVPWPVSLCPSAGDGNKEVPCNKISDSIIKAAGKGRINIAGGCCGTTPRFISDLSLHIAGMAPRSFR